LDSSPSKHGHHNGTRTSSKVCQVVGCTRRAEPASRLCVTCQLEGNIPRVRMCGLCKRRPVAEEKSLYCSEACANTAQKGAKALKLAKRNAQLAAGRRAVR